MRTTLRLVTLALFSALPLAVFSADPGSSTSNTQSGTGAASVPAQFRQLDRNKDGMISQTEAKRSKDLAGKFEQIDSDRDGQISVSEWQSGNISSGAAGVSGESRERSPSGMESSGSGSSGMGTGSNPGSSTY